MCIERFLEPLSDTEVRFLRLCPFGRGPVYVCSSPDFSVI